MTKLPAKNILDGSKTPKTTTGEMKDALGKLRDYLNDLLGEESSDKAAARLALGIDLAELEAEIAKRGVPVGSIDWLAVTTPPAGYLKCDGAAVGRGTYPDLFAAIGTTFGAGDGETTFNLPDLMGRFAQGSATPGTVKEAGLPDVTGTIRLSDNLQINAVEADKIATANGVFSRVRTNSPTAYSTASVDVATTNKYDRVDFSLASQNPLYGNSDTVQPPALTLLPCIKAFDAAVNPGPIDVTELANEVTTKTTPAQAANAAMPSDNYIELSDPGASTTGTNYTAPADGFFCMNISQTSDNVFFALQNVNSGFADARRTVGAAGNHTLWLPVKNGDVILVIRNTNTFGFLRFYYANWSAPQ